MFCGSLPPTTNEVTVEDICRNDFIEVLRHIYGSEAKISFDNVYGIWYAAQKYLLAELTKKCVDFVREGVNSSNVQDVFNEVQLFDNREIDKKCLQLLLDSPQKFFDDYGIQQLNDEAFRKFVVVFKDNCSAYDLRAIALVWLNYRQQSKHCCFSNKVQQILATEFNIDPTYFEIEEKINPILDVNYLDSTLFQSMMHDQVTISTYPYFSDELHGIGIYVGCHPDDVPAGNSEWIVVEVKSNPLGRSTKIMAKKTLLVRQESTPSILPIMLDKLCMRGKISISIRFPDERRRAINPVSLGKKTLGKMYLSAESTCVAYLIEKTQKSEQ
jgi:BTB/POZ domain